VKLPWECFNIIVKDDRLNIKDEKILVELFEHFMDARKHLPIPDEDNLKKTFTENLTEEELKERVIKKAEADKKKEEERLAKEKEETDKRTALTT